MAEIAPPHPFLFWAALFFIGGALGSFLCVCVRRVPKGLSVISPPSACETCLKPIRFYANIPVAGFFICRGACLRCGARFSPFYPAVEALCAASAVAAVYVFGLSFEALRCFIFLYALIAASAFDLSTMTVPDFITLPFAAAGILFSIPLGLFPDAAAGGALGGGILLVAAFIYKMLRKKEGLGMGDVKLMVGAGAFIGAADVPSVIFAASITGAIGGIAYLKLRGQAVSQIFPFAPFIAVCSALFFFAD
ncbi:prepilin peptidase [Candidatus Mycalebacterium sp.]